MSSEKPDLTLTDNGRQLTANVEGKELVIRYHWARDGVMSVDFVGVPREFGGRGLGTKLVGKLVEKARADDFQLVPVCSFAALQLQRHKDWHDVLA